MSELDIELQNRLCEIDNWYSIWYKDQRFEFRVFKYAQKYSYFKFGLVVAIEKEIPKFFGGTKKIKETLRERFNLNFNTKNIVEITVNDRLKEYRFHSIWPELKTTIEEVLISDVAPDKPFVINCSQEFPV